MQLNKQVTIQSYPHEAAWFDGSRTLTGWVQSGSTWSVASTVEFDSSPTYTRGAPDNSTPGWGFINPLYPMAAHGDQVWVDGQALKQVETRAQVVVGTFYADYANDQIVLGSDPTGKSVVSSDLIQAMLVMGKGTVLRGFGVRNYAPCVCDFGSLVVRAPDSVLENLTIVNSAAVGLAVSAIGVTTRSVTVQNSGMLGIGSNYADGGVMDRVRSEGNNTEKFNFAPVSGGIKITRTRGITVKNSVSSDNYGTGMWFDESVYDMTVVNNTVQRNGRYGIILEICAKATIANNLVSDSVRSGIAIANTADVKIWNNTVVRNQRAINITQDARLASNQAQAGHDPRQSFPDTTMTWISQNISIRNNVMALSNSDSSAFVGLEDVTKEHDAAYFNVTLNGNVYNRTTVTAPRNTHVWTRAGTTPLAYATVAAFAAATGQEASVTTVEGSQAVTADLMLTTDVATVADPRAQALPSDVAALVGQSSGTKHAGVWR